MVTLDLTDREREILAEVLAAALSDVRAEISQTERMAFRAMLKERRDVIAKAMDALAAPPVAAG
jgi:hypothetical protein